MTGDETARLRAELMSADPSVQIRAARHSGRAKVYDLVEPLFALLRSRDAEVRATAWWAIDELHVMAAIPQLVAGLEDPDFVARSAAGWALTHLGPEAIPAVEAIATGSENRDAREMALLVLERVPHEAPWVFDVPPRGRRQLDASSQGVVSAEVARANAAAHDLSHALQTLLAVVPSLVASLEPDCDSKAGEIACDLEEALARLRVRVDEIVAAARGRELATFDAAAWRQGIASSVHAVGGWLTCVMICAEEALCAVTSASADVAAGSEAVQRASQAIHRSLLLLTEVYLGRELDPRAVSARRFAAQSRWLVRRMTNAAGLAGRIVVDSALPDALGVDFGMLTRLVDTLLDRTLEGTVGGEVVLEFAARDGGLLVRVRDTRRGFVHEHLAQGGEQGGGRIAAASTPGEGATFEVWLPASPTAADSH